MRQIKDIFELVKILKGNGKDKFDVTLNPSKNATSIKAMASKSVLQFPLLVSDNISEAAIAPLAKALEGEYATLLQIAMENDEIFNLQANGSGKVTQDAKMKYISKFHTNLTAGLKESGSIIGDALKVLAESGELETTVDLKGESKDLLMNKMSVSLLTPFSEDINRAVLNDMYNIEKVSLTEAPSMKGMQQDEYNAHRNKREQEAHNARMRQTNADEARKQAEADRKAKQYKDGQRKSKYDATIAYKNQQRSDSEAEERRRRDAEQKSVSRSQVGRKVLGVDPNKSRINNLPPLILTVRIKYMVGETLAETELTLGVKTVIHAVPASEFAYFLPTAIRENNLVFRAIQFTTGEIRFVRDFLLNINRVKRQSSIAGNNKRVTKWWHTLTRLSKLNKIMNYFNKNKFLPSTTMIISIDDVQNIKTNEGIDILTPDAAKRLYKIYFLLGLIVVDESSNTMYIFDEEDGVFKIVPFSHIKNEAKAGNAGDLKTLMNLLSIRG